MGSATSCVTLGKSPTPLVQFPLWCLRAGIPRKPYTGDSSMQSSGLGCGGPEGGQGPGLWSQTALGSPLCLLSTDVLSWTAGTVPTPLGAA